MTRPCALSEGPLKASAFTYPLLGVAPAAQALDDPEQSGARRLEPASRSLEGRAMPNRDLDDPKVTPRDTAESEEQEAAERFAAERGPREGARRDLDDPREEEGWTQPESSAQKGAVRDDG